MKKVLSFVLGTAMLASSLVGCASQTAETTAAELEGEITASGSSALKPLADIAAELFMEIHEDVVVTINAGGSGTGLKDIAAGTVDIGNSDLFAEEKLTPEQAAGLVDHKVCTVTMAPIVNKDLGVTDLTTDQLKGIFTGTITNWSEVGGPDLKIELIVRPEGSGTKATFQAYALGGDSEVAGTSAAMETDNSGELVTKVSELKGAIGYVAMSYFGDSIQPVSIDGVEPTLENTYNGTYKVWSYEHMYTNGEPAEPVKSFLEFMMGDEFAAEIEANGYGASSKLSAEAIATHE